MARAAVDQYRAGTAFAPVTADLGAGQAGFFPQVIHQQHIAGDHIVAGLSIKGQ